MSGPDYQIEIKVRNGRILQLMRAAGLPTVSALCRSMGTSSQSVVGDIVNLKVSPLNRDGQWRPVVLQMAEALNVLPDDLFSDAQRTSVMASNRAVIEASEAEVQHFLDRRRPLALDDAIAAKERDKLIGAALERLTPREKNIIEQRFGLSGDALTLEAVAEQFGVSMARIRQIEAKALRKMRLGPFAKSLSDLVDIEKASA